MKQLKRSTNVILLVSIIMVVLSTVLTGCGNQNKKLEGTWSVVKATHEDLDGKIIDLSTIGTLPVHDSTFVFSDDLTIYSDSGDVSVWSYNYKDNVLELKTEGDGWIYSVDYTGDRLVLTSFTMQSVGGSGSGETDELRIELVRQ